MDVKANCTWLFSSGSETKENVSAKLIPLIFNYCSGIETIEAHLLEKFFTVYLLKKATTNYVYKGRLRTSFEKGRRREYVKSAFRGINNPLFANVDGYNESKSEVLEIRAYDKETLARIKDKGFLPIHTLLEVQASLLATTAKKAIVVCTSNVDWVYSTSVKVEVLPNKEIIGVIKRAIVVICEVMKEMSEARGITKEAMETRIVQGYGKFGGFKKKIKALKLEEIADAMDSLHYIPCEQTERKAVLDNDVSTLLTLFKASQSDSADSYHAYKLCAARCDTIRNAFIAKAGYFIGGYWKDRVSYEINAEMELERKFSLKFSSYKAKQLLQKMSGQYGFSYSEADLFMKAPSYAIKRKRRSAFKERVTRRRLHNTRKPSKEDTEYLENQYDALVNG